LHAAAAGRKSPVLLLLHAAVPSGRFSNPFLLRQMLHCSLPCSGFYYGSTLARFKFELISRLGFQRDFLLSRLPIGFFPVCPEVKGVVKTVCVVIVQGRSPPPTKRSFRSRCIVQKAYALIMLHLSK
jgi:hypothetical protein